MTRLTPRLYNMLRALEQPAPAPGVVRRDDKLFTEAGDRAAIHQLVWQVYVRSREMVPVVSVLHQAMGAVEWAGFDYQNERKP